MADPYRLIPGDRVIIDYDFLEEPKTAVVDLDGDIRLAELGRIGVAGSTLDEVEETIVQSMLEGGFSGVSYVSVEIAEYAPVIVSGFVGRSGRVDYLPGMNVGAALALAGGPDEGPAGQNTDIMALNAVRRADEAAERVMRNVIELARLEAGLAGPDVPIAVVDEALSPLWPAQRADLPDRVAAATALLENERATTRMLVASWDKEVSDYETQTDLLDARLAIKEEVVATVTAELADLSQLREQGLATTTRLSGLQQRLADDREDLLNLENAKVASERSAAQARRNRDRYLFDERTARLSQLAVVRENLDAAYRDLETTRNEIALLNSPAIMGAAEEPAPVLDFALQGPRADRIEAGSVDLNTPLLPGDILIVTARPGPVPQID